ncbi:hypothetical protein FRX31_006538 [Thalictrum thalictroides]|uniref:Uncharacterized protein n=1 Tax=Thalictrum thalictroides TaxID=46969 RepID=A0A7J6X4X0_THATH|nr:hypothetical protein FRX31_006538 [Thalictrum thalictroides]
MDEKYVDLDQSDMSGDEGLCDGDALNFVSTNFSPEEPLDTPGGGDGGNMGHVGSSKEVVVGCVKSTGLRDKDVCYY